MKTINLSDFNAFGYTPMKGERSKLFVYKKEKEAVLQSRGIAIAPKSFKVVEATLEAIPLTLMFTQNAQSVSQAIYGKKHRPVIGGVGIGVEGQFPGQWYVGTGGILLYGKKTGKLYLLSNTHVVGKIGNIVYQPGLPDSENPVQKEDIAIGVVVRVSEKYDVALIELYDHIAALANVQAGIGNTTPKAVDIEVGQILEMHTRTLKLSRGYVVSNQMQLNHPLYPLQFKDDIMVKGIGGSFSESGSSGGAGVEETTKEISYFNWGKIRTAPDENGDVFEYGIGHPIKGVMEEMGLSFTKPTIIDEPDEDDDEPTVESPAIDLNYQTKAAEKATEYLQTKEVRGSSHNPTIVGIINIACNGLNLPNSLANTDETAWCSLFVIYAVLSVAKVRNVGRYKQLLKNKNINATARSWEKLDTNLNIVDAKFGDLVVFKKAGSSWQGHVGFYCGHNEEEVIVLGGNQSNSVNYSKYKISQLTAVIRLEDALAKHGTKDIRNEKQLV